MEVCGGQTHTIVRYGIDRLLPEMISLLHGPGCPVCVTSVDLIDRAIAIASQRNVVFCSFGDMLRVPGSSGDLLSAKARGADVRVIYSPLDALQTARDNPDKQIVLFGIGFETTAPANAMAVRQAKREKMRNFCMLSAQVLIPPAMEAILSSGDCRIDAFLAAGHVCTVMGCADYDRISARYGVPIVVTGFEPLDLLQGILMTVRQLETGRACTENQYTRSVRSEGNTEAQDLMNEVFVRVDRHWRGMGMIARSGLALSEEYAGYDAETRYGIATGPSDHPTDCISDLILRGVRKPPDCVAFGTNCTPDNPLGATMVSSEGTCNAYYRYRKAGPESET